MKILTKKISYYGDVRVKEEWSSNEIIVKWMAPQGDVSLEELKEAIDNTVLLDGIPAILFLSHYSYKELEDFTLKVLEIFSPNLIMGVSDELPPDGDIKKVKLVSEIVGSFKV